MKAIWNNVTIAEAPKEALIRIEGNWYFPPTSIRKEYFQGSDHRTHCHWRGDTRYYTIVVDGQENADAAWYYPEPLDGSRERIGQDFANFVAFWHDVEVVD